MTKIYDFAKFLCDNVEANCHLTSTCHSNCWCVNCKFSQYPRVNLDIHNNPFSRSLYKWTAKDHKRRNGNGAGKSRTRPEGKGRRDSVPFSATNLHFSGINHARIFHFVLFVNHRWYISYQLPTKLMVPLALENSTLSAFKKWEVKLGLG